MAVFKNAPQRGGVRQRGAQEPFSLPQDLQSPPPSKNDGAKKQRRFLQNSIEMIRKETGL